MTFIPAIRSIPSATMPQNKASIDALRLAVSELGGSIGDRSQRAVRIGELVDAGYLQYNADGSISRRGDGALRTLTEGLDFVGNSLRIRGDFSNADPNQRLTFQTRVPNGASTVGVAPNGTSTIAGLRAYGGTDMANAAYVSMTLNGTYGMIQANAFGTGTQPDLAVNVNGTERARFYSTSSIVEFGNLGTSPANSVIQLGSPNAVPGIVSLYSGTRRRDIRFASGSIQLGASAGSGAPTSQLEIFEDGHATFASYVESGGSVSGFRMYDRTTPANFWIWYSTSNILRAYYNSADKLTLDSAGNLSVDGDMTQNTNLLVGYRNLPIAGVNTWAVGKVNDATVGMTVNTGNAAGSLYYVYNNSAAAITMTQGTGLTLRLEGTATTGNRTIPPRTIARLWCRTTTEYVLSGMGVT